MATKNLRFNVSWQDWGGIMNKEECINLLKRAMSDRVRRMRSMYQLYPEDWMLEQCKEAESFLAELQRFKYLKGDASE